MEKKILNNYGSFDTVFVKGNGAVLTDSNGKEYIDFVAGIGANCLGHNYPPLIEAICEQAKKEIHISNYYLSDTGLKFSQELLNAAGFSGGYFCNSGAEANEAAIKLARKYGYFNGRKKIIYTLENSFHGRTLASLKATGQKKFHPPFFAPYPSGFKTIKYGCLKDVDNIFDGRIAALFIECIQGEGGVNIIDKDWAKSVCNAARDAGALIIADEVQTGIGRTGTFLASEWLGIEPDVITLAKGIAGGLPMGACLFRNKAHNVFELGDHQSTFAGNPLVCAAGRVVIKTVNTPEFLKHVNEAGLYIRNEIKTWEFPIVKEVRGKGLMIGIQIKKVTPSIVQQECLQNGLCISTAGRDVIRFLPPLTITFPEIDSGLKIFKNTLQKYI